MTPATYNITIPQRADFSLDIQLKDSTGTPINMTGYTVSAQIWNQNRTQQLATMVVTWVDRVTGKINLSIPYSVTSTMNSTGVWDLLVTSPAGKRDYWIRGKTSLLVGYTDV